MSIRNLFTMVFLATAMASIGCGDSDGSGGSGSNDDGSDDDDGGDSTGSGNSFAWAGNWQADLDYKVTCDMGLGNKQTSHQTGSISLKITGENSELSATVSPSPDSSWGPLSGSGKADSAQLSGNIPFKDHGGSIVSSSNNSVNLKLTVDGDDKASGTMSGQADNQFGSPCVLSEATLTMTR